MATLTPAQIATYAKGAGFSGDGLVWAVAVALAESGGRTDAVGVNSDGSRDRGLWQINSRWHPDVSDAQAFAPTSAAAAAYRISNGGKNWTPWAAYTNQSAAGQLSRARVAAGQAADTATLLTDPGGDVLTQLAGPVDAANALVSMAKSGAAVASAVVNAAEWIATPHNWVRIMEVGAGLALVTVAVIMMGKTGAGPVATGINAVQTAPAKAVRAASSVVPVGKATKLLK